MVSWGLIFYTLLKVVPIVPVEISCKIDENRLWPNFGPIQGKKGPKIWFLGTKFHISIVNTYWEKGQRSERLDKNRGSLFDLKKVDRRQQTTMTDDGWTAQHRMRSTDYVGSGAKKYLVAHNLFSVTCTLELRYARQFARTHSIFTLVSVSFNGNQMKCCAMLCALRLVNMISPMCALTQYFIPNNHW